MTVEELIQHLQVFPPDTDVYFKEGTIVAPLLSQNLDLFQDEDEDLIIDLALSKTPYQERIP